MKYRISTKYKLSWVILDDMGTIQEAGQTLQSWVGANIQALKDTLTDRKYPVRLIPIEEVKNGNDTVTGSGGESESRPEEAGRTV